MNYKLLRVTFCGVQSLFLAGVTGMNGNEEVLWNLLEGIEGHPVGSTISNQTLMKAGYVPDMQVVLRVGRNG